MCGLFGYSGKDKVDPLRLTFLAAENQARGDDATGVYGNFLAKSSKKAKDFVLTPEFRAAIDGATTVIGHTRKATVGHKIDKNAHPFELSVGKGKTTKSVVGTHNGQIFLQCLEALAKKYDVEKTDVDSEFVYKMLLHHNFDYNKAISELEGMMALAFVRPEFPEYLYLYHRISRPLAVGWIGGTNMYYSSETEPLELIGCQAIEPLDTDNLYIFKNGGLVEVSPVKKPQIIVTTIDQGVTTWMNTATAQEKAVLGISGADAQNTRNVTDHRGKQRYLTTGTTERFGTDGGGSELFRSKATGELSLLNSFPIGLFSDESSIRPPKVGRYYDGGNNNSCYLFAMLHCSSDENMTLPAWYVRLAERKDINCISTHNGIVALEIPNGMCNKPLKIEVINPMQQHVIYSFVLNKIKSGKVLEVALSIPFRCSEKETETSKGKVYKSAFDWLSEAANTGQINPFPSFPTYLAAVKSSEQVLQRVSKRWIDSVPRRCEDGERQIQLPNVDGGGTVEVDSTSDRGDRGRVRGASHKLGELEFDYDVKTDILDMNYYSVVINLEEGRANEAKMEELLSQPDPDAREMKDALIKAQNYIKYLNDYFNSRVKAVEEAEQEEAENDYKQSFESRNCEC